MIMFDKKIINVPCLHLVKQLIEYTSLLYKLIEFCSTSLNFVEQVYRIFIYIFFYEIDSSKINNLFKW